MRDGVHDRFENGVHGILWDVDARWPFYGADAHVAFDKPAGLVDLHIQGAGNVAGIQLIVRIPLGSFVADGLNVGARKVFLRMFGGEKDSGDGRPDRSVLVRSRQVELSKELRIV